LQRKEEEKLALDTHPRGKSIRASYPSALDFDARSSPPFSLSLCFPTALGNPSLHMCKSKSHTNAQCLKRKVRKQPTLSLGPITRHRIHPGRGAQLIGSLRVHPCATKAVLDRLPINNPLRVPTIVVVVAISVVNGTSLTHGARDRDRDRH
jgi:hypothetical protein